MASFLSSTISRFNYQLPGRAKFAASIPKPIYLGPQRCSMTASGLERTPAEIWRLMIDEYVYDVDFFEASILRPAPQSRRDNGASLVRSYVGAGQNTPSMSTAESVHSLVMERPSPTSTPDAIARFGCIYRSSENWMLSPISQSTFISSVFTLSAMISSSCPATF